MTPPANCYAFAVSDPETRPAAHWDATYVETLSSGATRTWALHVGDSFADVANTDPFYPLHRDDLPRRRDHGLRGGALLPGGFRHARGDVGVSAERMARSRLRSAARERNLRGRPPGRSVRAVDRGPLPPRHHGRLRRGPLLPGRSGHARHDGGLSPEDAARVRLRSAAADRRLRGRFRGRPVRALDRGLVSDEASPRDAAASRPSTARTRPMRGRRWRSSWSEPSGCRRASPAEPVLGHRVAARSGSGPSEAPDFPSAIAQVPSQRAVTLPSASKISAEAKMRFIPERISRASATTRSPRVGRKNDIARFTVADRVSGRVSQPTVPITRSKSPGEHHAVDRLGPQAAPVHRQHRIDHRPHPVDAGELQARPKMLHRR